MTAIENGDADVSMPSLTERDRIDLADAILDVKQDIGRLAGEVGRLTTSVSDLRVEVAEMRGENTGRHQVYKPPPSIPPLLLFVGKLPGKVAEHWFSHTISGLIVAAIAIAAHYLHWLK